MLTVAATTRGPLLDGSAPKVVAAALEEITDDVAQAAVDLVHQRLGQVLRNPTGYYRSRVVANTARGSDAVLVTDGGVVYGPWLEGVGSRNQTSRFKGYRTFRQATEQIRRETDKHAKPAVAAMVKKLGG